MTMLFSQMAPALRDRSKPAASMMSGQVISHGTKKLKPPSRSAIPAIDARTGNPIKASTKMTSNE